MDFHKNLRNSRQWTREVLITFRNIRVRVRLGVFRLCHSAAEVCTVPRASIVIDRVK